MSGANLGLAALADHEHDPCRVWCAYCGDIEPLIGEWSEEEA